MNSPRCQGSYLPPPPDQKGPALARGRERAGEGWWEGGGRGEGGGQRQETQGCWHVLFFHYVIPIPMQSALIFDEPSAYPLLALPSFRSGTLSTSHTQSDIYIHTHTSVVLPMCHFLCSLSPASWTLVALSPQQLSGAESFCSSSVLLSLCFDSSTKSSVKGLALTPSQTHRLWELYQKKLSGFTT